MNIIKVVSDYSSATISIKFAGNGAKPIVSGVSHTMAKAGEFIYIYGQNFEDIQHIIFPGDIEAKSFDIVDSKNIKVLVPSAGDVQSGYITVETAGGKAYSYNDINFRGG